LSNYFLTLCLDYFQEDKQYVELIVVGRRNNKNPSPDCSENPFLQKKIATESRKLLLKKNKSTIRRSQKASNENSKQIYK
jgi:hypothetical protein